MADDARPVDGTRWGEWVRAGAERLDSLARSWTVFVRNTDELLDVLDRPNNDVALSMVLMGDDREAIGPFWGEVDQRLHNELASAVSLVDHTRRLLEYLGSDVSGIIAEYTDRNLKIMEMNETKFLRKLRNYLLHYGTAPILQSLNLVSGEHSLKLNAARLLRWPEWNVQMRKYLSVFGDRDGPLLRQEVAVYATAMSDMYRWLFEQRVAIFNDPDVLDRFRIDGP